MATQFKNDGIPLIWTFDEPVKHFDTIGIHIDFESKILSNKPARLWRFHLASRALLRRAKVKGDLLEVWAGHATSLLSLARHGFSALEAIYKFIAKNKGRRARVWESVREEIRIVSGLIWLTRVHLDAPFIRHVDVGDSANSGYALMTTVASIDELREACSWRERWRFVPLPEVLHSAVATGSDIEVAGALSRLGGEGGPPEGFQSEVVRPGIRWGAGLKTAYANWLVGLSNKGNWLQTSAIASQFRARRRDRVEVDVPALVPPLPDALLDASRYRLLWARRWTGAPEHINLKEGRVALSSLRRSGRSRVWEVARS